MKIKVKNQESKAENSDFEVIIIGGGAAGISAALWCDELGLKTLLLESRKELGGQLLRVYNPIKNHLGVEAKNGRELRDIFVKQIEDRNFFAGFDSKVSEVNLTEKKIFLADGAVFSSESLIIATGVRRRKLNVEGEDEFAGRGVIESGKRDAETVAGKRVCIVGGGDAALENALILSETASHVFLIHRRAEFSARDEFINKVQASEKIKIFRNTMLTKLSGSKIVEIVELRNENTGATTFLPVDAVLLRIGVEPNTSLFRGQIDLDKDGYIKVNNECQTNLENIYAVGDVANPRSPTISTAVGTGATTAKAIYDKR